MKKPPKPTQRKVSWSFAQEMHLAFTEWVNRLPLIKKDAPGAPAGEDHENISSKMDKLAEE